MGSKKEGAQRVLDAHASSSKVKGRLVPVAVGILAIGLLVAYLKEAVKHTYIQKPVKLC
jgi:hypothetical protein